ncbi:pentapeptide repeat-containing protein [Dyadobacter sp. OTU695]|uniref:pentapeptide repeat-containing protein n=1 Tax=Dyadobacter sp. OTU695 TaxID=3043860 RepID=UPI00313CC5DC
MGDIQIDSMFASLLMFVTIENVGPRNMITEQLIDRWTTGKWAVIRKRILATPRKMFAILKDHPKIDGRIDLRGLVFVENPKDSRPLILRRLNWESVDLSYADLRGTWWTKCNVKGSLFSRTDFREVHIEASNFSECIFSRCDFRDAYMNTSRWSESGSFENVVFHRSNLCRVIFGFPILRDCSFENCKLSTTHFSASQFCNTKFIGSIESVFFQGKLDPPFSWFEKLIYAKKKYSIFNPMENVDFSQAELRGVSFLNGIDLRQCKFPKGDNYLLVTNPARTYKIAAELVRNTWHAEEQRHALILIKIYNANESHGKPVDFIDISLPSDNGKRLDLGRKFFETLRGAMALESK